MKHITLLSLVSLISVPGLASEELAKKLNQSLTLTCKKDEPSGGGRGKSTLVKMDLETKTMLSSRVNVNEGGRYQRLFAERGISGGKKFTIDSMGKITYAPMRKYRDFFSNYERTHCADESVILTPLPETIKKSKFKARLDFKQCAPITADRGIDYRGYYYDNYLVFVKCKIK